jgi:hypothetical protein
VVQRSGIFSTSSEGVSGDLMYSRAFLSPLEPDITFTVGVSCLLFGCIALLTGRADLVTPELLRLILFIDRVSPCCWLADAVFFR